MEEKTNNPEPIRVFEKEVQAIDSDYVIIDDSGIGPL